jgi:hypothetical protein
MTQTQKIKFLALCKAFKVKYELVRHYEICYTALVEKLHAHTLKTGYHDGHYWLVDSWLLKFNRISGTTQSAQAKDLKIGMAKSHLSPIDFLFERFSEIEAYKKKGWIKKEKY